MGLKETSYLILSLNTLNNDVINVIFTLTRNHDKKFNIFGRARNQGKKFLKLSQTSVSGIVHLMVTLKEAASLLQDFLP